MTLEEEIDTLTAQLRLCGVDVPCRCTKCVEIYVKGHDNEVEVYAARLRWQLQSYLDRYNVPPDPNTLTR